MLLRGVESLECRLPGNEAGIKMLQDRPLHLEPATVPDAEWEHRPRLNGHPAGVGWGTGRACVIY